MKAWGILMLCLALLGCAGPAPAPPASPEEVPLATLPPSSFGGTLILSQQITVDAPGGTHSLEVALSIGPERIDLVGLALGLRIIEIRQDAAGVHEKRHPRLPDTVTGTRILRDVMLAYWPRDVLAGALPEGWQVDDAAQSRIITRHGTPIVSIEYEGLPHWRGRTRLTHHRFGYQITIDSDEA